MQIEIDPLDGIREMLIRPRMDAMIERRHKDAHAKGFIDPIAWASWTYQGLTSAFPIYPDHHDPDRRREDGSP